MALCIPATYPRPVGTAAEAVQPPVRGWPGHVRPWRRAGHEGVGPFGVRQSGHLNRPAPRATIDLPLAPGQALGLPSGRHTPMPVRIDRPLEPVRHIVYI